MSDDMETGVEHLRTIIRRCFLWVDYGNIEQVHAAKDISTSSLYHMLEAVKSAIREREVELK